MPAIFVLDVPEFRPLVEQARQRPSYTVAGPKYGYYRIEAPGVIEFERRSLGFKPAVWHGALTGGLIGRIDCFDNDRMRLLADLLGFTSLI